MSDAVRTFEQAIQQMIAVAARHAAGHATQQELVAAAQALVKAERAANPNRSGRSASTNAEREPLVALRHTGRPMNSALPPDPRELIWVYGADKLGRALQEITMNNLRMVADRVQQEHPGTRRPDHRSRQSLVNYIVAHTPTDIGDWNPSMLGPVSIS